MFSLDISLIVSILSFLLAIVPIVAPIWKKKKCQISHYLINSYEIGKGLSNIFPDFQLHYKNDVLSNNVNVLQGGFMNTGKNDIGNTKEETFIKIILPEHCIVKAVKVSPLKRGLSVESVETDENEKAIMKNEIIFKITGLLKSNECFDYSAIIESAKAISFLNNELQFDQRIKNINEIRSIYVGQDYNYQTITESDFHGVFLMFIVAAVILVMSILSYDREHFSSIFSKPLGLTPIFLSLIAIIFIAFYALSVFSIQKKRIVHVLNKNKKR